MSNILKTLAAGSGAETDEYFNQTTLLLHGDGTNGAQNNTFLDSSTNNFTITRNGNTTQGTFSPFSLAAGEWSNYFDGSGDYLSVADNAAFTLGSGDFTIECWLYSTTSGARQFIAGQADSGGADASTSFAFLRTINNKLEGVIRSSTTGYTVTSSASIPLNAWTHVAFVRDGNTIRLYINGVQDGTLSVTGVTVLDSSNQVSVGRLGEYNGDYYYGYISNFRLVKGTCLYTGGTTFTVPTSPLTAVANTSLLTCQSNRFVDNSTNNFAITVSGNTSVQPFSPFAPSAAYDPSVNGGSGYFDGSGDYLSCGSNNAFAMGVGDFTWEAWVYFGSAARYRQIFSTRPTASTFSTAGSLAINPSNGLTWWTTGFIVHYTTSIGTNQWVHVALSRSGTTLRVFANGVQVGSATNSDNLTNNTFIIGANVDGSEVFNGYISNVRVVKGTAVYTSNFTPPTSPVTAIANTSLLCNFTNAGILDNTGKNNLETVGNAQIDTTTKKYGTGSMEFDGTGDYLTTKVTPTWANFGTSDFTIECWVYFNATSTQMFVSSNYNASSGAGGWAFLYRGDNTTLVFTVNSNVAYGKTWSPSTGTWYHVAVSRSGTSLRLFVDGTQIGTTSTSSDNISGAADVWVGSNVSSSYALNGFIDDLRITDGVARYTANFTPPSRAFPDL